MDELTTTENLYQLWMIYSSKNDLEKLREFIQFFRDSYEDLVDFDFKHLNEGFSDEGPHLTKLPDGVLQVFGAQLSQCSDSFQASFELEHVKYAESILRCLIVICRNYDNVPLVASCTFVRYIVNLTTTVVEQLAAGVSSPNKEELSIFVKLTIHFFECLYDPYFIWRKRLKGWTVDKSRLQYRPAALHVEVVPFFYECCEKETLPLDLHIRLMHMFGAIICGEQYNALRAVTPATLDILLKLLSTNQIQGPTNEQRQELYFLKDLILKCIVRMVHVIHSSSPDQRQVEVSHVMEGYMQVLLQKDLEPEDEAENHMQLSMIGAINEMIECHDKGALQVILVSGGTFDAFVSLLQKTALTGAEAQRLAMSVLRVINTVLSGSCNAKERFHLRVGYGKFVEALKCLGQPSLELLGAVLDLVVEGSFDVNKNQSVLNTQAAIMLLHWLPDIQSHDLQIWLSENLGVLCCKSQNNKMNCCNGGMIRAILTVLDREKQVNSKAVGYLIGLLESLGTHSITAIELKQLIGLLRLDEEEKQNPYCTRLMRAISTMARREGKEGALYFFNLQEPADSIMLPSIRKWPGSAFSFHTWLCLDCDIFKSTSNIQLYRRQIYSFITGSGCGFEAFLTPEGDLVIAVYNRKEYSTVIVADIALDDQHWHCLDIVHTSSKRPFSNSQLNVYIDGKLKYNSQFKFPNITEPIISCRIAGPCPRSTIHTATEQSHLPEIKKKSPLQFLFNSQSKTSDPGVSSIPGGSQDEIWGLAVALHGELGSVGVFHDALSPGHIKALYSSGPNHPALFTDEGYANDFISKTLLYYNAKACKDNICIDLSPNQNHGQLIGQCCVTWDIKDVINCIGGIQVLFPLLEQVDKAPISQTDPEPDIQKLLQSRTGMEQDDWVVIPSSSYADSKLEQNHVAGFLTLLRNILHSRISNQDTFIRTNGAATVGALLQKVNPKMIDVNVLMAVQLLVETMASVSTTMMNHLYQYILFDFRIWSNSDFPVRIGHIQYLSTIIKDDRKYFRKKFGVQFILDVIRMFYSNQGNGNGLSEEDSKTIRVSLLSLIKYYVIKDITMEELMSLMHFLLVAKEENMLCEALDVLISLLDTKRKQDQLYLYMYEPDVSELFYALLTIQGYSVMYYEKIIKVLYLLLKTDKVYEKNKTRLRLADTGHLGLVGMMQGCDVSGPMIKRFMEQVVFTDNSQSYNSILAVLQLIYYCGSDIKLEASRQILTILVTKQLAAKQFAKQLGWQEAIVKLLISRPHDNQPINAQNHVVMETGHGDDKDQQNGAAYNQVPMETVHEGDECQQNGAHNQVAMETVHEHDEEYSQNSDDTHVQMRNKNSERVNLKNGIEVSKTKVPSKLNLSCTSKESSNVSSPKTPLTPFYLTTKIFDDLNSSEDERSRSISRSSSASVEDLSSLSQRTHERHGSVISHSSSSISISESAIDLNSSTNSIGDSRRSSVVQAENIQRALDCLGIQNVYVKDNVERTEELTQNILIILLTIMWKGIEGSDKTAWMERGQVFSWIDKIDESNELIRPSVEIKRRLLEMMIHSCTSDIREMGTAAAMPTENALELVRLIRHFLHEEDEFIVEKFSDRLVEDTMTMLDMLGVWDVESDGGWKEMARLGLNLLILYARHPHLELCAVATAKLHTLVQTKLISSSAEASYLLGNLSSLIIKAVKENTDNYSFLIPVLKALMDKAYTLLNLDIHVPNLPPTSRSPTFFDDFKNYCMTEEWTLFVENYVNPQMFHFVESAFGDSEIKSKEFWDSCKESIMVNMHKKNREKGDSKLKFESQILDVYKGKMTHEQKRFQNITTQLRNQHLSTMRMWRATKRFFTGERGAWADRKSAIVQWKLSNQENFSRMKVKLVQNYNFDAHAEASFQRDNLGLTETNGVDQLQQLVMAKEALVSKDKLADDTIGDEDWNVISTQGSEEVNDKEKLILSEECELVTLVDVIKGRLEVTTSHVYFFDCSIYKEEGGEDFKWALSQLREIHFRRYNLRRSALEMFLIDQTNYFLNFEQKIRNKVYSRILSLHPPNVIYYGSRSPAELLKSSGLTQKWIQREISNFDYLIQLNTIAGRTYNDLSQYPVFPWILCDYESEALDLEDPKVYRDLSKPIGAVNPKNEQGVREKFETFEDPSGVIEKFHYGTHYSNAAGVMHYMVRMEPFTTLHIQLQSGRFDVADRQFHSLPGTWKMLMENPNDVKELIPEFFYLPEFLINMNGFDLGKLQISKETINDVILPKWANSPEDFINKHKRALESEYVSNNLHNWIDLIFGYKQKGPAAEEALNVFYYCTYEGAVDLDAVKDPRERKALEGMINNFGQTPCQLLKDPHPKRLTCDEVVAKYVKLDKPLSVFQFLNQLKVFFVEVSHDTDPLAFICVPRSQTHSIIQHGMPDTMVTVTEAGIIGMHGWLPYEKYVANYFTFEKDPSLSSPKTKRRPLGPFAPGMKVDSKLFVVSHDAKLLFSGGHWDNSLQVFNMSKNKQVNHIVRHIDVVTCLALDYCGSHLITGSRDTSCIIWQIQQQGGFSININNKPLQMLYGHDAEVTAVSISTELDIAVSAAKDGTVIMHTVRRGHYMRTLRPQYTMGYTLTIPHLALDEMGHIILYCHETFPIDPKEKFSLHVYSVNGKFLFTEKLLYGLGDMLVSGDYLVAGDTQGQLTVWEIFGLNNLMALPLHVPINSLSVTNGNSHIHAGLKDGKLIIVGVRYKQENNS